ncbi:MAG: sigma-54-dependent Fis family transcriptional regulator [Acidobacteriaceae bacterium]|nr:sigma-54-dependent Fis family transcriptional regulator [Acidobacteriaceae bacterium]
MAEPRILIVEDEDTVRHVMETVLRKAGYHTSAAPTAERAMEILQREPVDLVITDLHLPGASGIDVLKSVRSDNAGTTVIVMTAFGTIQSAVEAMKAGAYDYLTKPIHPYELKALVNRALEHHRLIEQVDSLRACLQEKYGFENIIGSSAKLMYTLDIAARVASSDVTILIQGETGTGKELLAKAIHFRGPRREGPFITVNCGAIPRELLESELFGHMKGSFTGAVAHKKGKAEMADGGTMLLDEIGEMPLELQVRVLRLIQEREIEKIGAASPIKLDVRIIAATHRNLAAMVKAGSFREDLYYRLVVVPIELPPLRERAEDIPELVQHFFAKCKAKYRHSELTLAPDVIGQFCSYSWPGNVRQLENAVERAVLLTKGAEITLQDLPDFLQDGRRTGDVLPASLPDAGFSLDAVEKDLIVRTLKKFAGNQTRAARFLHLTRRTLAYRAEKYGITTDLIQSMKEHGG